RIKAQDQGAVPAAEINFIVRPDNERPRARASRRVELPCLAGIRIDLHQEQQPAELIEVEVQRLAAAAVRPDNAPHQTTFANRDAEGLKPTLCRHCSATEYEVCGAKVTEQSESHGSDRLCPEKPAIAKHEPTRITALSVTRFFEPGPGRSLGPYHHASGGSIKHGRRTQFHV